MTPLRPGPDSSSRSTPYHPGSHQRQEVGLRVHVSGSVSDSKPFPISTRTPEVGLTCFRVVVGKGQDDYETVVGVGCPYLGREPGGRFHEEFDRDGDRPGRGKSVRVAG